MVEETEKISDRDLSMRNSLVEQIKLGWFGRDSRSLSVRANLSLDQAEAVEIQGVGKQGANVRFGRVPGNFAVDFETGQAGALEEGDGAPGVIVARRIEDAMDLEAIRVFVDRAGPTAGDGPVSGK